MDGVVADFTDFATTVLDKPKTENQIDKWTTEEWQILKAVPNLYAGLNKMPQADSLIALARKFRTELGWNLYFLTAVPKKDDVPDAFYDKVMWVNNYYPDITVRFGPHGHEKHLHCQPGDILVDDRTSNCQEWAAVGGQAIKVTGRDFTQVLAELEQVFQANLK